MKIKSPNAKPTTQSTNIRQKAESLLKEKSLATAPQLPEADTQKLIHELQVHQIELELQNEELILANIRAENATLKFTELYDFAPTGYFTLSKNGEILGLNLSGAKMLGKKRAQLTNNMFGFFVSGNTKPIFNLFLRQVFNGKTKETCEVTLSMHDEPPIYVQLSGVVTESGKQCLISLVDITEHNRVEQERLESSEERYRILYENAKIGLYRTTPDGTIVLANRALVKMLGYPSFDELAKINVEHGGFETPYQRKVFLDKVEQTGEIENFETTWIRQDRTPVYVHESARAIRDANGNTLYYDGTVEDITKRKQAEEALIESEEKYRALFETSLYGISLLDLNGKIIFANKQVVKLFGYNQASEFIGLNGFGLIHPEDKPKMDLYFKEFITTGVIANCEVRSLKKDGSEFIGEYSATIIKNANGDPVYMMDVVRDITEHKRAEEALKKSELRFEQISENAQESIWEVDSNGLYTYISPVIKELLGYEAEEIIGHKYFYDLFEPESKEVMKQRAIGAFARKECFRNFINCNIHKDGRKVILSTSGVPILDKENTLIGYRGVDIDITERIHAEELLKSSEEQYRTLFEHIHIGIGVSDMTGKIIAFNDAMLKPGGYSRDDIIRLGSLQNLYYNLSDREAVISLMNEKGFVNQHPIKFKRKDGSSYDTLLSLSLIYFDNQPRIQALVEDITERKQTEEALIDSENRARAIIDAIPDLIFRLNKQGVYIDYKAAKEDLAYQAESIIGKRNRDMMPPDFADLIDEKIKLTLQTRQMQVFEYQLPLPQKGVCEYEARMVCSRPDEVIVIVRDVTERKKAEAEIKRINEKLIKLNTEKDKFFSLIAHDLRGPFNGFLGLTQLLAEYTNDLTKVEIQKISLSMRDSATNLFRLLENLLHWARMQQGLIPFNPKVLKLLPVANESIEMQLESAKIKDIEIITDFPADISVFADSDLLQTVIRNLISNAIKFTPIGGKIHISAKTGSDKTVEISISDTGIGMDKEMMDNLFRLDVQTNRKGTEGEPSTGLGLLLCKEFIEKHGGKLWVESEEKNLPAGLPAACLARLPADRQGRQDRHGKAGGSTFYFTIPLNTKYYG